MMESNFTQNISALKKLPKSWKVFDFADVFIDISGGNKKFLKSDFLDEGKIAVVDQGKDLIAGYVNEENAVVKSKPPYIVFGDHTRILKYIEFPFVMGADGTKVFKVKEFTVNDEKYLFHFLKSLNIPDTGYNRHFKYLKSTKIPVPPLLQQQKIANILDAADELRQNDKKLIAKYDALTQALFLDMFGDPVSNLKGWELVSLSQYGSFKNGLNFNKNESGSTLKYLGVGDFKSKSKIADIENLSDIELNSLPADGYLLKDGDLVFVRSNGNKALVGRCVEVYPAQTKLTFSGFCIRYRVTSSSVHPTYLTHLFRNKSFKNLMLESGQGANIQNINQQILSGIDVPLPPFDLQNQFVERMILIEEQKAIAQNSLEKSEALFNSLLQKAFKGEL